MRPKGKRKKREEDRTNMVAFAMLAGWRMVPRITAVSIAAVVGPNDGNLGTKKKNLSRVGGNNERMRRRVYNAVKQCLVRKARFKRVALLTPQRP
jgi:hypothetical protein